MAKVSIVIPTLNRPMYLYECIESCLNQKFKDIEVIVADNCSETKIENKKIIDSFKDKRLQYYYYENRIPMGDNWSRAIKLAKGKYVKILCDDDLLHNLFIKVGYDFLEDNKDCAIFSSNRKAIIENETLKINDKINNIQAIKIPKDAISILSYLDMIGGGTPTQTLLRKKEIEKMEMPFDSSLYYEACDVGCWIKLYNEGGLIKVNKNLCFERIHKGQYSKKWDVSYFKKVFSSIKYALWVNNEVSNFKDNLIKPDKLVETIFFINRISGRLERSFFLKDILLIPSVVSFFIRKKKTDVASLNKILKKNGISASCTEKAHVIN